MVGWFRSRIYNFSLVTLLIKSKALGIKSRRQEYLEMKVGHWVAPELNYKNSDVAIDSISSLSEQMVNAWDAEFNTNLTGYGTMS